MQALARRAVRRTGQGRSVAFSQLRPVLREAGRFFERLTMSIGANTLDGSRLLEFIARVEVVDEQIKDAKGDRKVIIAEAEQAGFAGKGINLCVKARAMKPREFEEHEQVRDLYLHAVGLAHELPLFRQLDALAGEELAREDLIRRFEGLVPSKGEITLKLESGPAMRFWRDKNGKAHSAEVKAPQPAQHVPAAPAGRARAEVPDVDADEAEALGRRAAAENNPIISNPFPFGDARRRRFDEGWRKENGSDGMGPDDGK
jgi:uncharacterized protein (UPF0335 family)